MKKVDSFKDFVLDQLAGLHAVDCKRMFGGYGIYQDGVFFAILHEGRLYFKTSKETLSNYKEYGMSTFSPNSKQTLKSYYEVPVEVLEDSQALMLWAKQAIQSQTHGV